MSRTKARFLPTLLTLVTVVLAGLTAAGVHRLVSLEPGTSAGALAELRAAASLPEEEARARVEAIATAAVAREASHDRAVQRIATLGGALFAAFALLIASLIAAERNARNLLRLARTARAEADRARSQLVEAVENISEGFVLYDSEDRLVLCNRRFREAYRIVADVLRPGVTSEEILRAATERGQFPQAEDKETWIANRLAQRRRFDPPFEQQLAGGRWHMVSDRPTRDGGLVGIRTDITELKRREIELREARRGIEQQAERARSLAEEAQQAKAVLQDAIESVNEGFCLFDRDDRLVMCNSRYLDLHGAIRDAIRPGASFAEITRAAIEKGAMTAHEPLGAAVARREAIQIGRAHV